MRSHTGERPFPCSKCGWTFKWLGNLKRHEVSKHKGKNLNVTKKSTLPSVQVMNQKVLKSKMSVKKSKANLNIASLKNKNVAKKKFSGKVDGASEKSHVESDILQAAMAMSTTSQGKQLPWRLQRLCRYCGISMPNRRALVIHERRHNLNLPLQCKVCGLSFEFKSYLRKHQLKHVSNFADTAPIFPTIKSYCCSDCKQEFAHENMLAYHRTVAHGDGTSTGTT
uniref:C2H2-type domain-containing protein n=1 Tax=Eptatretus burgeri TaxID=7764 RepID=A0A8C4NIJ0_EPTBU